jgi:hypothetical protein
VPVTVTVYVPAVVPELPPLLLPLPQASKPPVRAIRKMTIPILVCHLRRRAGIPIPKSMAKARSPVPLAAAAIPTNSRAHRIYQSARRSSRGDGERGRPSAAACDTYRAGRTKAQSRQVLSASWAGCNRSRKCNVAGEASVWGHSNRRSVAAGRARADGHCSACNRKRGRLRGGNCNRASSAGRSVPAVARVACRQNVGADSQRPSRNVDRRAAAG